MQNKQETSELIERFLKGELQGKELNQLRGLLSSEEGQTLKEEILFHTQLQEITTTHEEQSLQNQFRIWAEEVETTRVNRLINISYSENKKWYYLAGIAASVFLLWFASLWLIPNPAPSSLELAQEFWADHTHLNHMVRGDDIHQAYNFFNAKQYAEVKQSLSNVPSDSPFYINALLLSGVSSYMLQQIDTAKIILKKAANHKKSLLIDEAQWRLALVYLLEKDYNAAKNILNELQHLQGYRKKAAILLQSLPN